MKMIKLRRDDSVFYTTETVDYFIKHRAEFHSNIEELKQCRQRILDGEVVPRINIEQGDKFFIFCMTELLLANCGYIGTKNLLKKYLFEYLMIIKEGGMRQQQ